MIGNMIIHKIELSYYLGKDFNTWINHGPLKTALFKTFN